MTSADAVPAWLMALVDMAASAAPEEFARFEPVPDTDRRVASVLILFGGRTGDHEDATLLLLERAHDMRSHAGQVAFPGGARDAADADAVAAALREAHEETGIDPDGVDVLASLPPLWLPPSRFEVTPVVGWWREPSPFRAVDPAETASVHAIRIGDLLDPQHRVTIRHPSGYLGPAFLVEGLVVWGFTAGIISMLFTMAGWDRNWDVTRVVDLPDALVASSMRDLDQARGAT